MNAGENAGENAEEDSQNGHQVKTSSISETLRMVGSVAWKGGDWGGGCPSSVKSQRQFSFVLHRGSGFICLANTGLSQGESWVLRLSSQPLKVGCDIG